MAICAGVVGAQGGRKRIGRVGIPVVASMGSSSIIGGTLVVMISQVWWNRRLWLCTVGSVLVEIDDGADVCRQVRVGRQVARVLEEESVLVPT